MFNRQIQLENENWTFHSYWHVIRLSTIPCTIKSLDGLNAVLPPLAEVFITMFVCLFFLSHTAIDLLEKMLELDADKRINAEEALAHSYLAQYADPSDEPTSPPYDQSFEDMDLPVEEWKGWLSPQFALHYLRHSPPFVFFFPFRAAPHLPPSHFY